MSTERPEQHRDLIFIGHVQGVGFRATAASLARRHSVCGFARNLADGNVEVVVEGAAQAIERFIADVRAVFSKHIRDVRESIKPAMGGFAEFEIRY